MLTMWQYWKDNASGRSVLVAFQGERFGAEFDVPNPGKCLPKMRCAKRVSQFAQRHSMSTVFPSAIALELLRQYVTVQSLAIQGPS